MGESREAEPFYQTSNYQNLDIFYIVTKTCKSIKPQFIITNERILLERWAITNTFNNYVTSLAPKLNRQTHHSAIMNHDLLQPR